MKRAEKIRSRILTTLIFILQFFAPIFSNTGHATPIPLNTPDPWGTITSATVNQSSVMIAGADPNGAMGINFINLQAPSSCREIAVTAAGQTNVTQPRGMFFKLDYDQHALMPSSHRSGNDATYVDLSLPNNATVTFPLPTPLQPGQTLKQVTIVFYKATIARGNVTLNLECR